MKIEKTNKLEKLKFKVVFAIQTAQETEEPKRLPTDRPLDWPTDRPHEHDFLLRCRVTLLEYCKPENWKREWKNIFNSEVDEKQKSEVTGPLPGFALECISYLLSSFLFGEHYGSKQPGVPASDQSLSHELGSEWVSERASERVSAAERASEAIFLSLYPSFHSGCCKSKCDKWRKDAFITSCRQPMHDYYWLSLSRAPSLLVFINQRTIDTDCHRLRHHYHWLSSAKSMSFFLSKEGLSPVYDK